MAAYTFQTVKLALIDRPARPSRIDFDPERLGALADSIAAEGLHQPIGVCGPSPEGRYLLAWGDRRREAHILLQRAEIEAKVFPWGTDLLLAQVSENNNREALSPVEEAREIADWLGKGHSQSSIARLFRRSPGWVAQRVQLAELDDELQAAVHCGDLGIGVALALSGVDHAEYRASLIEEAARTGASAATVAVWVAHYNADKGRIVTNHMTVQEIVTARADYRITFDCPCCKQSVDYAETVAVRLCSKDAAELLAELAKAPAAAG